MTDKLGAISLNELEDRMTFAAFDRCQCGAGLAYDPQGGPDAGTPFNIPSLWHCSDTLLYPLETPERRAAIVAAVHDRPVDMSMGTIRGERRDRGTTRSEASQKRHAEHESALTPSHPYRHPKAVTHDPTNAV